MRNSFAYGLAILGLTVTFLTGAASAVDLPEASLSFSFNNQLTPDTGSLSWQWDTSDAVYADSLRKESDGAFSKALTISSSTHPGTSYAWPETFSAMAYMNMAAVQDKGVLISFGNSAFLRKLDSTTLTFGGTDESNMVSVTLNTLSEGYHLIVITKTAEQMSLQIDGRDIAASGSTLPAFNNGLQLGIRWEGANANAKLANGLLIDELAFYDSVLTKEQAAALAEAYPSLPAHFTAAPEGSTVTFSEITWAEGAFTEGEDTLATLTLQPGATLIMDQAPTLKRLNLVCSGGNLTLRGANTLETPEAAFTHIGAVNLSGVVGDGNTCALTLNQSLSKGWTYTQGAGSSTASVGIEHTGGTVALNGGTYYLSETTSSTQTAVTIDNAAVFYSSSFGIGTATYTLGGSTAVSTPRLILSQGDAGRNASLTLKDTATLSVSGETNSDANTSSIMIGHWNGPSTLTLQDTASFTAEKADLLLGKTGNTQTINLNGGTLTARGIKLASNATGTNRLNLNGGTLRLGATGITSYNASRVLTLTVNNAPVLEALADFTVAYGVNLADGAVLTVKPEGHTLTFAQAFSGAGALKLEGSGTVDLTALETLPVFAGIDSGITLKLSAGTLEALLLGGTLTKTLTPVSGAALAGTVELWLNGAKLDADAQTNEDGSLTLSTTVIPGTCTGNQWFWDYEFTGNLTNIGSDGTALTQDGSAPVYSEADAEGNRAVYLKSTPYRRAAYGSAMTAVMRCKPAATANAILIAFGTTIDSGKCCLMLATGANPAAGDMRLCLWDKSANTVTELVDNLKVPNATADYHVYAFSLAVVDGKTQVAVYVDGKRKTVYKHSSVIELGNGFQIGSAHGGFQNMPVLAASVSRYADPDADSVGTVDFLRVTNSTLSAAAMQAIAQAYPYTSENGRATRSLTANADETWVDEASMPWAQTLPNAEETAQAQPNAGTAVELTLAGDAALTLNLPKSETGLISYESLTVSGDGALTLKTSPDSACSVAVGDLTLSTDLTVPAEAFQVGTLFVGAGKTLTFDCSELDVSNIWVNTTLPLTGLTQLEEGAAVKISNLPAALAPRAVELVYSEATESYALHITVPESGLHAAVSGDAVWSSLEWKLGDTAITPNWSAVTHVPATLEISGAATLTLAEAVAFPGTLRITGADESASLTLTGSNAFSAEALTLEVSTNAEAGTLALSTPTTLAPGITVTLHEAVADLSNLRPSANVSSGNRPTLVLAEDCAATLPTGNVSSSWHNLNLTIPEGTTSTLTANPRIDMCGATLTVAGTLTLNAEIWLGVSYGSLNGADSAIVVQPTGSLTCGTVLLGGWGQPTGNTVDISGQLSVNNLIYHSNPAAVAFTVKQDGRFTLGAAEAGGTGSAAYSVTVEQGGTLAGAGAIHGALTLHAGAALDASAGVFTAQTLALPTSTDAPVTIQIASGAQAGDAVVQTETALDEAAFTADAFTLSNPNFTLVLNDARTALTLKAAVTLPAGIGSNDLPPSETAAAKLIEAAKSLGISRVSAVSGQTAGRTLTAEEIEAALLCFAGDTLITAGAASDDGTPLTVGYDFGFMRMTAHNGVLTVTVAIRCGSSAAELAEGSTLKLLTVTADGTETVLDCTFTHNADEGTYTSTLPVEVLTGKMLRVKAEK